MEVVCQPQSSRNQTTLATDVWAHVPGVENPADLASRGVNPLLLASNSPW